MHTESVNQQLAILTPTLTERLHKVTTVQRELTRLGCKVAQQELQSGAAPKLILSTITPEFRRALRSHHALTSVIEQDNRRYEMATFMGVSVAWQLGHLS